MSDDDGIEPTKAPGEIPPRREPKLDETLPLESEVESQPTLPMPPTDTPGPTEVESSVHDEETLPTPKHQPPAPATTPQLKKKKVPAVIASRYQVLEQLGEGGMGRVFRVRDSEIQGRELALKLLRTRYSKHPSFRSLFFTEVKSAQEFVHEHVNQVRDTGQDQETGELFMTMDMVEGESLRSRLRRENQLATRHALEVARQVLLGLQAGHDKGLIHRDVKPENIMLAARVPKTDENPYGVGVRLLDFGLSGVAAEVDDGQIAGTPTYMSPEQAQGQRLDARSDLFAVGVVLYEMIAGTRPFHGKSVDNILTSVLETDVAPLIEKLEHLSPPVRRLLRKALEKKRDKRFQSADQFIAAIEKSPAYQVPVATSKWAVLAAGVFGITAAATGTLWWFEKEQTAEWRSIVTLRDGTIEARGTTIDELRGEIETLGQAVDKKQDEVESVRAGMQVTIGERDAELTKLTGELAAAQSESVAAGGEEGRRIVKLEADLKLVNAQLTELEREKTTQDGEMLLNRQEIADLRTKLDQQGSLSNPAFLACSKLDIILTRMGNEKGLLARRAFAALMENEVILSTDFVGHEFLDSLTVAAVGLETYETSESEVERSLGIELAAERLATARAGWESFRGLSAEWIGEEIDGNTAETRLAALESFLQSFDDKVTEYRSQAGSENQKRWDELVALAPDKRDPAEMLGLAELLGGDRFDPIVTEYIGFVESRCLESGTLRADPLGRLKQLDAWGNLFLEDEDLLARQGTPRLLTFAYAQRWYDRDLENDDLDLDLLPVVPVTSKEPTDDWAAELRLKLDLARRDEGFQGMTGSRYFYVVTFNDTGEKRWQMDRVRAEPEKPADAEIAWRVQSVPYDEEGNRLRPDTRTIIRFAKKYADAGNRPEPFIDCGRPGSQVGLWSLPAAERPPSQIPIDKGDLSAFRNDFQPTECVVVRSGRTVRWISPELGLVYENNGRLTRELVYAQVVR